jgi:hypothetical protein
MTTFEKYQIFNESVGLVYIVLSQVVNDQI